MKKRLFIVFLAIFGLWLETRAFPVDQETAMTIACKFMKTKNLQLITTYNTDKDQAAFHIFNTPSGFVIVAADDCETPIIGYSNEGQFDPNNVPVQMEEYLQGFVARIQYSIENQIVADEHTLKQWDLVKTTGRLNESKSTKSVMPLITARWQQGCLYNSLCPTNETLPCGHAQVGCVAVAMGQIMHYWKYPTTGWGSHSYSNAGVGLSADFGNTVYQWDLMPDTLTDNSSDAEIEAVATLLFHCGVSVEMNYSNNGSGASSSDVPDAMKRYFNYSKKLHREKKCNDNAEWLAMLKECLDLQRPLLYSGHGSAGHAFVCDGYDDNDLLHFNWGWGGFCDGYFALGNLNPNGYDFNDSNYAVFDISPDYEPYQVVASVNPPTAGSVIGTGDYHIGELCQLTAMPTEHFDFFCWKDKGIIISDQPSITLAVEDDFLNIEADFSCFPVDQLTVSPTSDSNGQSVSLSWSRADTEWVLLKQFDLQEESGGLATDGEHIYVTNGAWNNPDFMFEKYDMDGNLLEKFNLEGIPDALCLAYDGTSFYCNSLTATNFLSVLYQIDLDNKRVIDSTEMNIWFGVLTYDPEYDGFWLTQNYKTTLVDRQGQGIITSPSMPDYINGSGYYLAKDGNPHLMLSSTFGVYDYDITNNYITTVPLLSFGETSNSSLGTCTGKYDGKDALFIVVGSTLYIFEIKSTFTQIVGYRIYRSNDQNDTVTLADGVNGISFIDSTWIEAPNGVYRFGISSVFANGIASDIVWSEPITKTDHGIDETETPVNNTVQKVFENGQIIIIKDDKRYNIAGQQLNN